MDVILEPTTRFDDQITFGESVHVNNVFDLDDSNPIPPPFTP